MEARDDDKSNQPGEVFLWGVVPRDDEIGKSCIIIVELFLHKNECFNIQSITC